MTTVLTRMVARLLLAPVLMVAAAILIKGYVDVGDGFAAGVIAALGILLQYLAFGRAAVQQALPVRHAAKLAVAGLLLSLAVAFVPVLAGGAPLQHARTKTMPTSHRRSTSTHDQSSQSRPANGSIMYARPLAGAPGKRSFISSSEKYKTPAAMDSSRSHE